MTTAYVLESGKPLARSLLWEIQRRYFEVQGVEAWRRNVVPHYITNNPYTAQAYARVVLGYLRDCLPALNPNQLVYIVELGAGSGRFAFHFLRKFHDLLAQSPCAHLKTCYVLTDLAEANLDFWRQHPAFQDWLAAGQLDYARFDAASDQEIRLRHSGVVLGDNTDNADNSTDDAEKRPPGNPLVVLANYFFDSLPQDAFHLEEGRVRECRVTLTSSQVEPDPSDPAVLPRLTIRFDDHACRRPFYQDARLESILEDYRRELTSSYLLFPSQGIRCLDALAKIAGERMLLISGDSGVAHLREWQGRGAPDIHIHGSFSMRVNYHAIGQFVQQRGGQYLTSPRRAAHLTVCAFTLGESASAFAETHLAFAEAVERGGPDEFFLLKSGIEKNYAAFDLEELLAYLRISGWDGRLFLDCYPALLEKAPKASARVEEELVRALEQLWANYFHLGEERDLPFDAGVLLFKLGRAQEALAFFERSLECYGHSPSALYNAAMCLAQQRRFGQAQARIKEALVLDPTFEPALQLAAQLRKFRPVQR